MWQKGCSMIMFSALSALIGPRMCSRRRRHLLWAAPCRGQAEVMAWEREKLY
jgi:hypothetical protein